MINDLEFAPNPISYHPLRPLPRLPLRSDTSLHGPFASWVIGFGTSFIFGVLDW